MFLQRGLADERVKEVLPAFSVFGRVRLGASDAGHVVAPIFIEFTENLELLVLGEVEFLVFARRCFGVCWRGAVRPGVLTVCVRWLAVAVTLGGLVQAHAFHGQFLERWITLQL